MEYQSGCIYTGHYRNNLSINFTKNTGEKEFQKEIREQEAQGLQTPAFQIFSDLAVKFPDIKAGNIFPVKIDHVSVGNTPSAGRLDQGEMTAPSGRIYRNQSVIDPIKMFYQRIAHI